MSVRFLFEVLKVINVYVNILYIVLSLRYWIIKSTNLYIMILEKGSVDTIGYR